MTEAASLKFGIVGLGRIGGSLAAQACEKGAQVVGVTQGPPPAELSHSDNFRLAEDLLDLKNKLEAPRKIFLYVPAGPVVSSLITQLMGILEPGDLIVDGGNSYWGDSIRRAEELALKNLRFIDMGTSGGASGARHGACFMAGGREADFHEIEPILAMLSVAGGYTYTGPSGSGHLVKLIHNGIEFGMLQAIGEGMNLLEKAPMRDQMNIPHILHAWNHGSVVRSWLMELMEQEYNEQNGLSGVPDHIEDTGEVNWLVSDAMALEVPVPAISLAVNQLIQSRQPEDLWAKSIAMMRHGFGEHPYGPEAGIAKGRRTSRVGDIYRDS